MLSCVLVECDVAQIVELQSDLNTVLQVESAFAACQLCQVV